MSATSIGKAQPPFGRPSAYQLYLYLASTVVYSGDSLRA